MAIYDNHIINFMSYSPNSKLSKQHVKIKAVYIQWPLGKMYKLNVYTKEDSLPMMNQEGEYTDVSEIRTETKCKWQYKYIF